MAKTDDLVECTSLIQEGRVLKYASKVVQLRVFPCHLRLESAQTKNDRANRENSGRLQNVREHRQYKETLGSTYDWPNTTVTSRSKQT